jgi:hypothetical protein
MSDTPETDNLARGNHVVSTGFAQDLERQLSSARAMVHKLRRERAVARQFGEQMERERDAIALKSGHLEDLTDTLVEELQTERRGGQEVLNRIVQERDQWRECAETLVREFQDDFDPSGYEYAGGLKRALSEFERLKGETK